MVGGRRPLIATRAAGASQYVRDGENGLLLDIDDVPALAQAMARLSHDGDLRQHLITVAAQDYQTDFAKPVVLDRLLETYATVLKLGKR